MTTSKTLLRKLLSSISSNPSNNIQVDGNPLPRATGTFVQQDMTSNWGDSNWQSEFTYMKEAGMDILVFLPCSITRGDTTHTIYPTDLAGFNTENNALDRVDICLRNAQKAGVKVFLGIQYNDDWWTKAPSDENWFFKQMEISNQVADELYRKYHHKYPKSFHGWYWVYEVSNANFRTERDYILLSKAININLKFLKQNKMRLPILLSPFMNGTFSSPKRYADNWATFFKHTDLEKGDIFCPQDSVGAGWLKMSSLDTWFAALKKATSVKPELSFWANVENFDHSDWSSATLDRFIEQMRIESRYVDNIITFSYNHYYSPNNIDPGLHHTYLNYLKTGVLDSEKPSPPTDVNAKKLPGDKYEITWKPATDNIGLYGYHLYRNGKLIFTTKAQRIYGTSKKGPETHYIDDLILNRRKPAYEVKAFDFAGNISNGSMTN